MVTKILTGSGSAERGANSSDGSRSPRASRLACSLSVAKGSHNEAIGAHQLYARSMLAARAVAENVHVRAINEHPASAPPGASSTIPRFCSWSSAAFTVGTVGPLRLDADIDEPPFYSRNCSPCRDPDASGRPEPSPDCFACLARSSPAWP
ncbi:hypothetical protein GOA59_17820 [Sinorhizobium meliloti]|nr:hypothetical protein [Sinorhizobium meliloti]MDW9606980.1 hypothetical protein [Sinorhizobium meliloti]MDW9667590.1 hypothetical protein [Sinorhizobium meliloti]MDW9674685.1 hypothetical protein [Sinorhizobium meliloti]MDW9766274.1 hypothetical protein [Sinorhizobium meliloti]